MVKSNAVKGMMTPNYSIEVSFNTGFTVCTVVELT